MIIDKESLSLEIAYKIFDELRSKKGWLPFLGVSEIYHFLVIRNDKNVLRADFIKREKNHVSGILVDSFQALDTIDQVPMLRMAFLESGIEWRDLFCLLFCLGDRSPNSDLDEFKVYISHLLDTSSIHMDVEEVLNYLELAEHYNAKGELGCMQL